MYSLCLYFFSFTNQYCNWFLLHPYSRPLSRPLQWLHPLLLSMPLSTTRSSSFIQQILHSCRMIICSTTEVTSRWIIHPNMKHRINLEYIPGQSTQSPTTQIKSSSMISNPWCIRQTLKCQFKFNIVGPNVSCTTFKLLSESTLILL